VIRILRAATAAVIVALIAACGTARTTVNEPVKQKYTAATATLEELPATITVPDEVRTTLRQQLEKALFDAKTTGLKPGSDLKVQYRFVQFNAGNQFARWFWGGIGNAGEASMQIEAIYVDAKGQALTRTQHEGRIGSGFFGGSVGDASDRMAEEVANFVKANFR